ncbi:MAG: hypothetical protein VXW15_11210 [Bdellovibrionota bacterium]|nr:hypothetical protein [Bdellovibrionota bacterium]|tara:strand:+ start:1584 stop:2327 length:744 start_codon:yes stop_codon:yes gene_type:complete
MRLAKAIIGIFILLVGIYFLVNVKEMTPTPFIVEEREKTFFVQNVSSKLSSKRPNLVKPSRTKQLIKAELNGSEKLLPSKSDVREDDYLEGSQLNGAQTDPMDPLESEIEGLDTITDEDIDQLEVYFDGVEKNWKKRMSDFMINELGLTVEKQEEYDRLRDEYEEEKISAMEDFHEYMEDKFGEGYVVEPNHEQEYFQNKIKGNYFEKLKSVFGEEGFDRYLEHLGEYNQKISEEQDPDHGVFLIEI